MVTVTSVCGGSPAEKAGILPEDILLSINGHDINDVLDYRFYITEPSLSVLLHRGPELLTVEIEKDEYDDPGLEFQTYLMDEKRRCRNACIFCFIDQMPPGCRDSLYFKDDDDRLSFLQGNYITTTNLTDEEIDRICRMHLSPINISVHTTDPELRVFMMKNKNAGKVMSIMRRFADAGITMNGQIVLCKDINDGAALDASMREQTETPSHRAFHRAGLQSGGKTGRGVFFKMQKASRQPHILLRRRILSESRAEAPRRVVLRGIPAV